MKLLLQKLILCIYLVYKTALKSQKYQRDIHFKGKKTIANRG